MANESGKCEFTNGKAALWVGKGEVKFVGQSAATMTVGAKTDLSIGLSSALAIGLKTNFAVNGAVEFMAGASFTMKKQHIYSIKKSSDEFYADSAVMSVGIADALAKAKFERMETLSWILLICQSIAATGFAGLALARLIDLTASGTEDDKGNVAIKTDHESGALHNFRDFPFGYVASGLTAIGNFAALGILLYGRFKKTTGDAAPNAVLSLEKESAAFIGIAPLGKAASAGMALDENGVEISAAASDMEFRKAAEDKPTILGFKKKPGHDKITGSRLKLRADGHLYSWAKHQHSYVTDGAVHLAASHEFKVADARTGLRLKKDRADLKADADNFFTTSSAGGGKTRALGGKDAQMALAAGKAILAAGDSGLTCTVREVKLKVGNSAIKIGATGIDLGGQLTILAPAVPNPVSVTLTELKADIAKADAASKANETQIKALDAKQAAQEAATALLKESLIQVRQRLTDATSTLSGPGGGSK